MRLMPVVAVTFTVGFSIPAAAMPLAPAPSPEAPIVQVWGGCGPYGHRGPYGGCRPGGQWGGYRWGRPCPPGFHLGPYGRRCWPNWRYY
jgi:hypothetical protein